MMTMRRTLKTEYPLSFKKASAQSAASNDFEILTRLDELSAWSGLQRDDDAVLGALSKKASQSRRVGAPDQLHLTSSFYEAIHNVDMLGN
jgi:hypothetical protein